MASPETAFLGIEMFNPNYKGTNPVPPVPVVISKREEAQKRLADPAFRILECLIVFCGHYVRYCRATDYLIKVDLGGRRRQTFYRELNLLIELGFVTKRGGSKGSAPTYVVNKDFYPKWFQMDRADRRTYFVRLKKLKYVGP